MGAPVFESMLSQPVLYEGYLPLIIHIAATPLFQWINGIPHPFLGKEALLQVFKTPWPDNRHAHIGKPHIPLRVPVAIKCFGVSKNLKWDEGV
jgi:hypothetical protein